MEGADLLRERLDNGTAKWVVEMRCPATLHAAVVGAGAESTFEFEWDIDAVTPDGYFIPGMVTTEAVELGGRGLHPIWRGHPIVVPAGRWLVRGNARGSEQLGSSLIKLFSDEKLANGRMTVEPFTGDGDLRFHVKMSPKMYELRRYDRDVQMAALIAAFGRIPGVVGRPGEEGEGSDESRYPVLERIERALEDADVADWTNLAEYDPAEAATAVEQFSVREAAPDDDDE